MTATTQSYMPASVYDPSNMFASPNRDMAKGNDLFKSLGNATVNRTVEPHQTTKDVPRTVDIDGMGMDDASFFDFEPSKTSGSPYRDQFSTPGASGLPWSSGATFHPISPPQSATFSPKDPWGCSFRPPNPASVFTNVGQGNTRAQYGQVTPPDDEVSMLDFQLKPQQQRAGHRQLQAKDDDLSAKKRKRNNSSSANEQVSQSTKRSRKYAKGGPNVSDPSNKPEDVKRSKFLERNRVAASKCRQKKKEWTQNLENRARELQKNNNLLRLNVESLRQEILFLKSEMLKHSNCDCEGIQSFIKAGGSGFLDTVEDSATLKREESPLESTSDSSDSPKTNSLRDFDSEPPATEQSNASIVNDENALEALLSNSINHDTSDEGVAPQVA
ncbi:hypothetical protein ACLMJK_000929 [Lecanora helva]